MEEGWHGDEYLILFMESELPAAGERYGISNWLPGYVVMGLRGWDDLIVKDSRGNTFSVPAVPLRKETLSPYSVPGKSLTSDSRFTGKIKWYLKPVVLGGDPAVGENVTWVDHAQHGELVRWWNQRLADAQQHA